MNTLLLLATLLGAFAPAQAQPRIVTAIELPVTTRALRHAGALEVDLQITLASARRHHLPPADVVLVFSRYVEVVELRGPVHGFGPFVAERWDAGVRGKALAAAIQKEHGWKRKGHGPYDVKHGGKHYGEVGHGNGSWKSNGRVASRGNGNAAKGHPGKGHGNGKGNK